MCISSHWVYDPGIAPCPHLIQSSAVPVLHWTACLHSHALGFLPLNLLRFGHSLPVLLVHFTFAFFSIISPSLFFLSLLILVFSLLNASFFKGIVSRDWEWFQWVLNYRLEEYRLPEYICNAFRCYIHVIIGNKHALVVSPLTVTLRMISNSPGSSPVINAHLLIDQAGGSYCSDRRKV